MAAMQEPQLDETVWTNPTEIQRLGGLNQNTVHFYFSQSPFFDRSSKNGILITQAQFNPSMAYIMFNRDAFERRLQEMSGVEYLIASDTPELRAFPSNDSNGIWILRKQDRKSASLNAEVEVLGTYFIVNTNVFMASSLGDIMNNRLLTSTLAISKALSTASNLSYFTPRTGHSYFPPLARPAHSKDGIGSGNIGGTQSATTSRSASPIAPDTQSQLPSSQPQPQLPSSQPQSQSETPALLPQSKPPTSTDPRTNATLATTRALVTSFALSAAYADEYMDENPLRGEPGSFVRSATSERVAAARRARLEAEEEGERRVGGALRIQEAAAAAKSGGVGNGSGNGNGGAGTGSKPGTPGSPGRGGGGAAETQVKVEKGAGGVNVPAGLVGKAKRRKSKASVSPTSPIGKGGMA